MHKCLVEYAGGWYKAANVCFYGILQVYGMSCIFLIRVTFCKISYLPKKNTRMKIIITSMQYVMKTHFMYVHTPC